MLWAKLEINKQGYTGLFVELRLEKMSDRPTLTFIELVSDFIKRIRRQSCPWFIMFSDSVTEVRNPIVSVRDNQKQTTTKKNRGALFL
jgi:hypothetical protein